MRTHEDFSAPDRDMANVDPELPPAESDDGPVTDGVFSMLTIALGIAACLWGAFGIVVEGNPAPTPALAMVGTGICFVIAGVLMLRTRGLLLPLIAAACGVLLGMASRTML